MMRNKIVIGILIFVIFFIGLGLLFFKSGLGVNLYNFMDSQCKAQLKPDRLTYEAKKDFIFNTRLLIFVLSIPFGITGYFVGKYRKRNGFIWASICFLFNVLGLIILFSLPPKR